MCSRSCMGTACTLTLRGSNLNAFPMIARCSKNAGTGIYAELTHEQLKQVWRGEIDQDVAEALARFQSRAVLEGREIARTD